MSSGGGGPWGRRAVLTGLASAAASSVLGPAARASDNDGWLKGLFGAPSAPAPGASAKRPVQIESRNLGVPDFSRLHPAGGYIAGVRPHRDGGVRLERAAPVDMPDGARHLVHNYGHGGAGITLSFGTAERARDLVAVTIERHFAGSAPAMAVLGAGVIGLTTARAIKARWPGARLTVYAAECEPARTTSFKAGGMLAPISTIADFHGAEKQAELNRTVEASRREIERLGGGARGARLGIARKTAYSFQSSGLRLRLGGAVRTAGAYETWLVDPTVLLGALRRELEEMGVDFVTRRLREEGEVYALPERLIVNCTGYGARRLFTDERMEPRRGHLVRLENPGRLDYILNSWCGQGTRYLFARGSDIIIGGSIQRGNDWDAFDPTDAADVRACERILRSARSLFEAGSIGCA